jgi:antitoxin ParD1/3/4
MATMNVSLPDNMKEWAETQVKSGRYSNTSDYVRALIRKDLELAAQKETLIRALEAGEESGISDSTPDDIYKSASADV